MSNFIVITFKDLEISQQEIICDLVMDEVWEMYKDEIKENADDDWEYYDDEMKKKISYDKLIEMGHRDKAWEKASELSWSIEIEVKK